MLHSFLATGIYITYRLQLQDQQPPRSAPTMKVLAVLSLIGSTLAIMVVSPDNTTTWSSSATSQMVSWQAVATDPTTFTIQLVQNVSVAQA